MDRTTKRWHLLRRDAFSETEFIVSFLDDVSPNDALSVFSNLPPDCRQSILDVLADNALDEWTQYGVVGNVPYDPNADDDVTVRNRRTVIAKMILENNRN